MISIYRASSIIEADVIRSILREEGIDCFLWDKYIGLVYPPIALSQGIRIVVEEKNLKEAKKIIKDYFQSINKEE
ncbi:DUF2007 domain-containing protein [Candidatus Aerophobetes bacterium]|nr:DUF2007 domain-containing protein [Candidatus Aerophobetes bacterium]